MRALRKNDERANEENIFYRMSALLKLRYKRRS